MKFKKILVMGILSFLLAPKAGAQTFSEACYTPGLTRFQLFAPDNAKQVTLRIYDDGQGGKPVTPGQESAPECLPRQWE